MEVARKKKMGRKKIEKKSSLEVTFSKRRTGLFKKAGDVCVLCGAEAAVIVFSPGGKAFVFGHPTADAVIDRFLGRDTGTSSHAVVPAEQVAHGQEEGGFWWEAPIDNMGLNELEQFKGSLEKLREKVADRVEEMTMVMVMESESGAGPSSATMLFIS
ncbi:hypothetical protein PVL29_013180 [Vitis rotundifolia]|uniref:MADS-box domain-containing protein n=1 Tax=Vitis rotundifolia TaxID=103349 RepID=A0AA38ZLQ1_VITRO|nr:hypothetical protein PVL29_013180 [Vitis rotundifolia]